MSKLIAFGWYGGKFSHLDWLLPLLPKSFHFCEPFGGSAAVLLNREPSPVETYNDVDGEVVNFFRVLRDQPEELIRVIALTPFSRKELEIACTEPTDGLSDLERAAFLRARPTDPHRFGANGKPGQMGLLCQNQPRWCGRSHLPMVWWN